MATVTTIDPIEAVIQVLLLPDFIHDMEGLLDDLKNRFQLLEIYSHSDQVSLC